MCLYCTWSSSAFLSVKIKVAFFFYLNENAPSLSVNFTEKVSKDLTDLDIKRLSRLLLTCSLILPG